jgi:hypothetical protein
VCTSTVHGRIEKMLHRCQVKVDLILDKVESKVHVDSTELYTIFPETDGWLFMKYWVLLGVRSWYPDRPFRFGVKTLNTPGWLFRVLIVTISNREYE